MAKKNKKIKLIIAIFLLICIVLCGVFCAVKVKNNKYNNALESIKNENYSEAYGELLELNDYKDSKEQASKIKAKAQKEEIGFAKKGDTVYFGGYDNDWNTRNGKERIEWLVLDRKDGKVLVISKDVIECQQYHMSYTETTWEKSSLRKWLNNTFINTSFSAEERAMIETVSLKNISNTAYGTDGGKETKDKVFLLSAEEVNRYLPSKEERLCKATLYAEKKGVSVSDNGSCWWWLRNPGDSAKFAMFVDYEGEVADFGRSVYHTDLGVRPAMWLNIN